VRVQVGQHRPTLRARGALVYCRTVQGRIESSRESTAGAGWDCQAGRFQDRVPKRAKPFSWLSPRPLLQSRNDRLARVFDDPTNDRRRAWMARLAPAPTDLLVSVPQSGPVSFLVMGDTGEGDGSQFAVVEPLRPHAADTAFLFICSDVIYPAGGIDDYCDKFFDPYKDYPGPIYAVPGNHDWYDDATGFMYWFCGAEDPPPRSGTRLFSKAWVRDRLWRRAPRSHAEVIARARELRKEPRQQLGQPAPYFAIDVGELRLVGIDTGITGSIDSDQATWLREISRGERPKILLTGKPIYVDGCYRPGKIEGEDGGTIDDVVTDPDHHYIAAIGGDIHNYQRYPVRVADGRTILYLVSGGGGAFMHETYSIKNIDCTELPLTEAEFRCYPLRGDCLSRFSQLYARKLRLLGGQRLLFIAPDSAAAIMAKRLKIAATRPSAQAVKPTWRERISAAIVLKLLPGRGERGLHLPFSEWLDWNEPPMFKSFLRFDADAGELTIRCFAANGCAYQQDDPPVEDELRARRGADGRWEWRF
jgi:Calcineurin-like phosphoesterase